MKRLRPLLIPVAAIVSAALLNTLLLINVHVPSGSMEPAIPSGSMVLGNRLAYRNEEPAAGDVVIFRHPEAGGCWLIKRVVAVPGQSFSIRGGQVYIDGLPLSEAYVQEFSADDYPDTVIPEGCYFVMGDNRTSSADSRAWNAPFVRREDIIARALFVYFPEFQCLSDSH